MTNPLIDGVEPAHIAAGNEARRNTGRRPRVSAIAWLAGAAFVLVGPRVARADEPVKASEPSLMAEPGEVVDVVDAFDSKNNDPFDMNLSLGFHQSWESAKIRRESTLQAAGGSQYQTGDGSFVHDIENIATYKHTTSVLNLRADVGLYHDLGLFFRVPFTIADDRSLEDLDGSSAAVNATDGSSRIADPANGQPLFSVPFKSPTRSGVDYVAAGLRWSIFNQHRDSSKPTWTIELEGRFGVGEPMHACNASPGPINDPKEIAALQAAGVSSVPNNRPSCANNLDPNQAVPGAAGDPSWYRNPNSTRSGPGISRGTNAVRFSTLTSYRYRYVEPYGGFWFMAEFQKSGTDIGDFGDLQGVIDNHMPLRGGLSGGVMIHPWENREQFQRFTVDLRFNGSYVSQGRDYSPLFDALGTSTAPSLIAPNPGRYVGAKDASGNAISVGDYSRQVLFTGVTDVEAYGVFGGSIGLIIQAAQYVRFNLGAGLTYQMQHALSASDACNPNVVPTDIGSAGKCASTSTSGTTTTSTATGTPNPNHRPVIDLPGRRFVVAETYIWDAWISGTVMF
jgi:hypothetical protein